MSRSTATGWPFPDAVLAALAQLEPISRDPLDRQTARLIDSLDRYSREVRNHGILSEAAKVAGERYDLVVKLYTPTIVAELARQLIAQRGGGAAAP